MNTFKFHPVGQGLFYTGELAHKTFNFVYDCGTEGKMKDLNNQIDEHLNSIRANVGLNPKIDFVVISHLHDDHFSGLYYLIQRAKVDKIYLPYLGSDKNLISLILAYEIFINSNNDQSFEQKKNLYNFMLQIYLSEHKRENRAEAEIFFIGKEENEKLGNFSYSQESFSVKISGNDYWNFIFINKRFSDGKIWQLSQEIIDIMHCLNVNSITDLISVDEKQIKNIKCIYEKIFGKNLNITSTILIHYPLYMEPNIFYFEDILKNHYEELFYLRKFSWRDPIDSIFYNTRKLIDDISILTGDALVDNNIGMLIKNYLKQGNENYKRCGILQVPHHGAKDNWIEWNKINVLSETYVIPFGLGNSHKHPHSNTIEDLKNKNTKLVHQMNGFTYYID